MREIESNAKNKDTFLKVELTRIAMYEMQVMNTE